MGMYSTFEDQDITVTDKKKLIEAAERCDDVQELLSEGVGPDFSAWSECKLYGYFYPSTVEALDALAECVEGWAEFTYEDGTKFRFVFRNKEWSVHEQPPIDWSKARVTSSDTIKKEVNR